MTDEDAAEVDKHTQLLIGDLERNEGMPRVHRVEVSSCEKGNRVSRGREGKKGKERTSDAGELGKVVDDRLASMYMVVDERNTSLGAFSSQHRYSRQGHPRRSKHLLRSVRMELGLFLLERHELGVDGNESTAAGKLVVSEGLVLDEVAVAVLRDGDVFTKDGRIALQREGRKVEEVFRVDAFVEEDGGDLLE
jgi:hypothetical protein